MRVARGISVRPAGAVHGSVIASRAIGRGMGFSFPGGRFGRPGGFRHHHHHHFFDPRFGFGAFGYPWVYAYYPGYWDYPLSDSYSNDDRSYNQQLQSYELQAMNNQQQIEQRIDALEARLDQLLTQKSAPQTREREKEQANAEPARPALLVYKDGHTQEVQNYAVVGQTLWVLNERQAKKISLSDLDLNATRRANENRNIEFDIPESSGS